MKCKNCKFDIQGQLEFCPNCGARFDSTTTTIESTENHSFFAEKLLPALNSNLFFVLCMLITVSCVLSFCSGGIPVINVLITIFLWIAFADAKRGIVNRTQLRNISGTIYALYIITNVASIIILVAGVICTVFSKSISLQEDVELELRGLFASANIDAKALILVSGIICIGVGVACLLINVLGVKKIHTFAKSVYSGHVDETFTFIGMKSAKTWLIVFTVLNAISAANSLLNGEAVGALSYLLATGMYVVPVILIDKHLA